MRVFLSVGLLVFAFAASALMTAQTRNEPNNPTKNKPQPDADVAKEKATGTPPAIQGKKVWPEKPAVALTSRDILARLQVEVETQPVKEKIKFKDFLDIISGQLQDRVTINLDVDAFQRMIGADIGADAPNPLEQEVGITTRRKFATAMDLLNQAVKQIVIPAAFIIRAGRVDIVPSAHASKEYMFNQTFRADFKDQRLDLALEELSDLTGVSIVLDARTKEKIRTTVTARFNDDVAMQDAVRMLTDMAELKIVYLVTGMYITTPEHAKVMQKELKDLYEPKAPPAGFGVPNGIPMMNDPPMDMSPLAPPLPPPALRGKRLEAAA